MYNIPDDTALRIAQLIQGSKSGSEAVNSKAQALYVKKKKLREKVSLEAFLSSIWGKLGQKNYAKSPCPSTFGVISMLARVPADGVVCAPEA